MRRRTLVLFTGAALSVVAAGAATGAIPGTGGEISGCYDARGHLRVIDADAGHQCRRAETALHWNQRGPKGPQGETGPQGEQGPQGTQGPAGVSEFHRVQLPRVEQARFSSCDHTDKRPVQRRAVSDRVTLPAGDYAVLPDGVMRAVSTTGAHDAQVALLVKGVGRDVPLGTGLIQKTGDFLLRERELDVVHVTEETLVEVEVVTQLTGCGAASLFEGALIFLAL